MTVSTSMKAYSEYSLTGTAVCLLALRLRTWVMEDKVDSSESLILCVLDNKVN